MLRIRPFETGDLLKIRAMNTDMAEDLMSHGNRMADSAVTAVSEEGAFLGAAYVLRTSSFKEGLRILEEEPAGETIPARCFLKGVFQAVPGREEEVECSEALLRFLQDYTGKTQESYPRLRVVLQLFGDSSRLSYQEFLMSAGFQPKALMSVMERDLGDLSDLPEHKKLYFRTAEDQGLPKLEKRVKGFFRRLAGSIDPRSGGEEKRGTSVPDLRNLQYYTSAHHWDPEAYRLLSKACFQGMPDSTEDIDFLLDHGGTFYFAEEPVPEPENVWDEAPHFTPGSLIATVMTWRIDRETAATENICCREDFRRLGVTTGILANVLEELREEGFKTARLNIFSDNIPAYRLYRNLGYEIVRNLIEYHYETRPEYRDY